MRSSSFKLPLLAIGLLLTLAGCGHDEPERRENGSSSLSQAPSIEDARRDARKLLGPNGDQNRAVWDSLPSGKRWSAEVINMLVVRGKITDRATDIEDFCPDYNRATEFQKGTCWLRIVSAIAKYESNFKPEATYLEASGKTSVGLLMMDPDLCPLAKTVEQLKNASANLACALPKMRRLIAKDHYISGPGYIGAAAFWSVLRDPYQKGKLFLGRKPHIQEFTRSYQAFRE